MVTVRILFSLLFLLSFLCLTTAKKDKSSGGIKHKPDTPKIYSLHVVSNIESRFATTLVTSKVVNPTSSAHDVTFAFELPAGAFVSNFSMEIDGQVIVGDVKEKEKAKQQYEAAKSLGQSAGLVSQRLEANNFEISVNVAAHRKVFVTLTYQEVLQRALGVYKHVININPGQIVDDLTVNVYIHESVEITTVSVPKIMEKTGQQTNVELLKGPQADDVTITKKLSSSASQVHVTYVPNQLSQARFSEVGCQLAVLYDVKRDQTAGEIQVVNGYFVHFFAPTGLPVANKRIVFVLDVSGSMYGNALKQLQEAMHTIMRETLEGDLFNIVTFSTAPKLWKPEAVVVTNATITEALTFVDSMNADGGTNIYDSLIKGLDILKNSDEKINSLADMIVFLTDGYANSGTITDSSKIVKAVTEANAGSKVSIHSICFGHSVDFDFLRKLSAHNRGVARKIYIDSDAALQLAGFYSEISSPLLANLKIEYLNETVLPESVVENAQDIYLDGYEIMVLGKLISPTVDSSAAVNLSGTITGKGRSGSQVFHIERDIPCFRACSTQMSCDCMLSTILSSVSPATTVAPLPTSSIGGFIERMWAYKTIQNILYKAKYTNVNPEMQKQLRAEALDLSLKYHFVTELTSMVVTQQNENATILDQEPAQIGQFALEHAPRQYVLPLSRAIASNGMQLQGLGAAPTFTGRHYMLPLPQATASKVLAAAYPIDPTPMFPFNVESLSWITKADRIQTTTTPLSTTTEVCIPYRSSYTHTNGFEWTSNYLNVTASTTKDCADSCFHSDICTTALFEFKMALCMLSYQTFCQESTVVESAGTGPVLLHCFDTRCYA